MSCGGLYEPCCHCYHGEHFGLYGCILSLALHIVLQSCAVPRLDTQLFSPCKLGEALDSSLFLGGRQLVVVRVAFGVAPKCALCCACHVSVGVLFVVLPRVLMSPLLGPVLVYVMFRFRVGVYIILFLK